MSRFFSGQEFWMNSALHALHVRISVPPFLRSCPDSIRGQVLEVGAGRGVTSRRILDTFPQVELTASDIDGQLLSSLDGFQEHYGRRLHITQADVLQLPFDREKYDIVLAINFFWRFSLDDVERVVRELLRVVRAGGLIGISAHHLVPMPTQAMRMRILETLVDEGCEILYDKGMYQYDVWVRKPYGTKGGGVV